jgi:hypothetical protein
MGFVHGAPAEKRAVQSVQRESAPRASAVMREPLEWYDDKADKTTQGSTFWAIPTNRRLRLSGACRSADACDCGRYVPCRQLGSGRANLRRDGGRNPYQYGARDQFHRERNHDPSRGTSRALRQSTARVDHRCNGLRLPPRACPRGAATMRGTAFPHSRRAPFEPLALRNRVRDCCRRRARDRSCCAAVPQIQLGAERGKAVIAELSLIDQTARSHAARLDARRLETNELPTSQPCIGNPPTFRAGIFLSDWVR